MSARTTLDVLVDWSSPGLALPADLDALPGHLRDDLEWACLDTRVWLVLPPETEAPSGAWPGLKLQTGGDAAALLRRHMRQAQERPRDLLVCAGTLLPGADVVGRLRETLSADAMFGAVAPRVSIGPSGDLVALGSEHGVTDLVPRDRLADLDENYILPELLFPCLLIRGEVLGNIELPGVPFRSLGGGLLDLLWRARRRGFRVVVDNRAVVPEDHPERAAPPPIGPEDETTLAARREDAGVVASMVRDHQGTRLERLLAAAGPARGAAPRRCLLDCRGMQDVFNGTSLSVLGVLDGLHALGDERWAVTVMASPAGERFFSLASRYPRFRVVGPEDDSRHAVALRLSQVWGLATWVELHRRALAIGVSMLDTIGIDILYVLQPGIPEAFQFSAEHADGLLFISEFSRGQFRRRFRVAAGVREVVHYLSLDPGDHAEADAAPSDGEPFVLVVGNEYDHKDVAPTARVLADAFPFLGIKALGLTASPVPSVEALPSGSLPADVVERLYATARCVVYPSFYEGFGLPLVKALAHGRTVFARRSPLLVEIAGLLPPGGRLVAFSTRLELVEALGAELHGRPVGLLPLGSALAPGGAPPSWAVIAARLCDFMEELVTHADTARWRRRDDALRFAAGGSQT